MLTMLNAVRTKITLLNIVTSIVMQIVSIISGLIVPRLILQTFGSDTNGLISSILQFLNYIALVEGGITGVVAANLYRPLVEGDIKKLCSVISTARVFYKKISIIFIFYAIVIGILYPLLVKTDYNKIYIFILTIVLSIGLFLQYMFSLTYTTLLNADKKAYIISITTIILTIANIILTLVIIKVFPDIIVLKLGSALIFALTPLVLGLFVSKHYAIDWNEPIDKSLIEQRWNGFAINLAFFIHGSTDITLLTFLSDLRTVSVYSVYFLVISKICVLVHSITSSIEPTIGQAYAKNDHILLNHKMDQFEFTTLIVTYFFFILTGLLITPFVMFYTNGINDANYEQPLFGTILVMAEAVYTLRAPHVSLAYSANKFKDITASAYIEAAINIVFSMVFIQKLGLVGVAIGTLMGMLYRGVFHIYFTSKLVPSRTPWRYYRKILIFLIPTVLSVLICVYIFPISEVSLYILIKKAVIYSCISVSLFMITSLIFYKNEIRHFISYLNYRR